MKCFLLVLLVMFFLKNQVILKQTKKKLKTKIQSIKQANKHKENS
jgi:hypothetical protein